MKDENALVDLSMDLAVEILDLVKVLKSNHETIVLIKLVAAEQVSVRIFTNTVCTQQS